MYRPHTAHVLLSFILSFNLLSFVTTAPSIPRVLFNATDLISRADNPQSHSPEFFQPDLPHHDENKNPWPMPISPERYKALVENGKLMFAYLQGRFDLPASKIQGPGGGDNVRVWYDNNKMALESQGWVPSEPSETKADILQRVCWHTIKGTKVKTGPKFQPEVNKWISSSWEKQVSWLITFDFSLTRLTKLQSSGARYSHMLELTNVGYYKDLPRRTLVVYEMKGLPESTYPATDLAYLDWEYRLRYNTPLQAADYKISPTAIIFANIYNKDAEDLAVHLAPLGTGKWPGLHFPQEISAKTPMPSQEYYSLLGTSFGQFATYFLRTHLSVFGEKRIGRIHFMTPDNLPVDWDTEVDGVYPHVFAFRIVDGPKGFAHQHDPPGGESSAQAAARLGSSTQPIEVSSDSSEDDTESNGGESPMHVASSPEGSTHSQDQPQEDRPGGPQNTEGVDQPMRGTTSEGSRSRPGQSSHPEHSPDRMEISEQSSGDEESKGHAGTSEQFGDDEESSGHMEISDQSEGGKKSSSHAGTSDHFGDDEKSPVPMDTSQQSGGNGKSSDNMDTSKHGQD